MSPSQPLSDPYSFLNSFQKTSQSPNQSWNWSVTWHAQRPWGQKSPWNTMANTRHSLDLHHGPVHYPSVMNGKKHKLQVVISPLNCTSRIISVAARASLCQCLHIWIPGLVLLPGWELTNTHTDLHLLKVDGSIMPVSGKPFYSLKDQSLAAWVTVEKEALLPFGQCTACCALQVWEVL